MADKIDKLTEEQEAKMYQYRDEALAIGLATGATNRLESERAIRSLYVYAKKPEPMFVFFVRSPDEAQKLIHSFVDERVEDHEINAMIGKGMNNDEIVAELVSKFKKPKNFVGSHSYSYGSSESYWVWHAKYMKEVLGVDMDTATIEGLSIMETLCRHSGWHYVFEYIAIICDRPTEVHMENGVCHNEKGPAIAYSDGFKCFVIEGHNVTEQIVMAPETLTLEQIDTEGNAEVKRIMIQRFGAHKYLKETGAKVINEDEGLGLLGSAPRWLIEDKNGQKWLVGTDGSTRREYFMPVPREVRTCSEAHQAISGLKESDCLAEC